MPAGRPAKPTAIKELEGNPGKRPLNDAEPAFAPVEVELAAPPWLDAIATEHWLYFAPILSARRVLTEADVSLLAAASERWSVYRRAAALLKRQLRGRRLTAQERMFLAEQAAMLKAQEARRLAELEPEQRFRGVLKRGLAPSGNELPAASDGIEWKQFVDSKLLGEYVVPPQHQIATRALQDYMAIMREFGVGPASRSKVRVENPEEPDAMSELFG